MVDLAKVREELSGGDIKVSFAKSSSWGRPYIKATRGNKTVIFPIDSDTTEALVVKRIKMELEPT